MAEVVGISRSTKKGVPKDNIGEGQFIVGWGLEGDAHGGNWHRQVSLLGQESIDKMSALGIEGLCSGKFAENITTRGIVLYELPIGAKFSIGDAVFEVTQIGKECHVQCEIFHQIGDCIMPKEGIFAIVIQSGKVAVGDQIKLL